MDRLKRSRSSPTGETPHQQHKKRSSISQAGKARSSRKELFPGRSTKNVKRFVWSDMEHSALVGFLILHRGSDKWCVGKSGDLWDSAARHIKNRTGLQNLRSGEKS